MGADAGKGALGVGRSHLHSRMIGPAALVVRNGAGERLLALRCKQRCSRQKTQEQTPHNDFADATRARAAQTRGRLLTPPCVFRGERAPRIEGCWAFYLPGTMMWADDVPANITQAPPWSRVSGSPVDCAVAPGTATVVCLVAFSRSGPRKL